MRNKPLFFRVIATLTKCLGFCSYSIEMVGLHSGSSDFAKQLQDYRLTTAEIIYHMPDHPSLLQSYVWQELDIAPRFPILHKFLRFWESRLEGKLFMVKVASEKLIKPSEFRYCSGEFLLN